MPISSAAMKHCKDVSTPRPKTFMNNCASVQFHALYWSVLCAGWKNVKCSWSRSIMYNKQLYHVYCVNIYIYIYIHYIIYIYTFYILYDECFVSPRSKIHTPTFSKNNNLEPRLHHVTCCNICKHWQQDICIRMKGLTCGVSEEFCLMHKAAGVRSMFAVA